MRPWQSPQNCLSSPQHDANKRGLLSPTVLTFHIVAETKQGISTWYRKDVKTKCFYPFYQIQRRMKGEKDQESSASLTFHYILFSSLGIFRLVTCLLLTHCCLLEFIHHTLLQGEKIVNTYNVQLFTFQY